MELKEYIKKLAEGIPPKIVIYFDRNLTEVESFLRNTIEAKIYPYTNYDPEIDNKDERGEVKSHSYIAVHDNNALKLIEKVEECST